MKLWFVAAAYGGWLLLMNLIFYHGHGQGFMVQEASILIGAAPMALQVLLLGFNPIGMARPARMMLIFLAIVLLSYLTNGTGWVAVSYVVMVVYLATVAILVAGCPDQRLLSRIAEFYSIPTALWLLYIDHYGAYTWGRLTAGDLQSNSWGLMAASVGVCAFAHRNRVTAAFCLGAAALTVYEASSRSSILGLGAAGLAVGVRYLFEVRNRQFITALVLIAAGFLIVGAALPSIQHVAFDFANNLFKLDDPLRGLGTGGTGRNVYWQAAIDLWWNHPWFGVGFRQHELYMPNNYEAHNAYLAMLADTGIFGLAWYVALLVSILLGMFKLPDRRSRQLAIALGVSYATIGIFERRAIDADNPMSLLFLMSAMMVLRESSMAQARRAIERSRRAWAATARMGMPRGAS